MVQVEEYQEELLCGDCGAKMVLRKDKKGHLFYGCTRFPKCRGAHSAHQQTGMPMGVPADKATRQFRMKAHAMFDVYWRERKLNRNRAYIMLAYALKIPISKAHIGMFTKNQCRQVIDICKKGGLFTYGNKSRGHRGHKREPANEKTRFSEIG